MNRLIILLSILILLAACSAKADSSPKPNAAIPGQIPAETVDQAVNTTDSATPAPQEQTTDSNKPKEIVPVVTFIELGAESCIPCKMMQPILKEIRAEYKGLVKVVFYDLYKEKWAGPQYNVRVMPTQVFLDQNGKEFFRHEGFYAKAEIEKMLADKGGVSKPK